MSEQAAELLRELEPAIADPRVLDAIASIPRELFVPESERERAYENVALPIACGQTISQPLVVARMLELLALRRDDRVLDIGTGSGYHAALLARLSGRVWTVEIHSDLTAQARQVIAGLGITNVEFFVADGRAGLPQYAPFDAINVAAAASEDVPRALAMQLADGGRLVAPVGGERQRLILITRAGGGFVREDLEPVRFVPLVGEEPD